MTTDPLLTSAQAADRLSVGATAIKRWADEGRLTCIRTAGGHRRFRTSDVERLRRQLHADADEWGVWIDTLISGADVHAVLALLFAERARLGAWHVVADRLGELLESIGNRWHRGSLSVADEHAASSTLQRALAITSEAIPVPLDGPRCLLASAEGDDHTLGLSLAEICLREAGWRADWAGRYSRSVDLCERVGKATLHLAALSASAVMQ